MGWNKFLYRLPCSNLGCSGWNAGTDSLADFLLDKWTYMDINEIWGGVQRQCEICEG